MRIIRSSMLVVLVATSLGLGSATLTRGHDWGDDFAAYIMQAKSILSGTTVEFIKNNTFTIFKSSTQIGPVAYPWGYPLILTPVLLFKGVHPLALKLPGLIFFAGFLICLYLLIKDHLTSTESLLIISLFAFNPDLIQFLDQILSDIPFLFFTFLGLLIITRSKPALWQSISLGTVLFSAFFIRTTGIILLASFLVYHALQFYYHQPERGTIFTNSGMTVLTFSLLWIITSLIFPNGQGSYFEQLKELTFGIFKKGLSDYFYLFGTFFGVSPIWTGIYYILVAFFLIGAWVRRQTDQPLIIFYILYLTAILFWPEWQGIRFIFPLLPIFVYFVFQGLKTVIEKLPKKFQRIGASLSYTFWFIIIGIFLFNSSLGAYANLKNNRQINGPFDSYSMEVYNFIQTKTPTHSIIVFYKPRAMRLFTNHSTLMSTECDRLTLGNYVVISKKAENSQIPPDQIDECGLRLKDVFENRRFIIYQVPK